MICHAFYSWNIRGEKDGIHEKLVVVYSIPYSHNIHVNWISIGLFDHRDACKKFHMMYYSKEQEHECATSGIFKRKDFYNDIKPLVIRGANFNIEATCGTNHQPTIKVGIFCEIST